MQTQLELVSRTPVEEPVDHPRNRPPALTAAEEVILAGQWSAIEALYRTEARQLTRYFERRVPRDDILDQVQECFRRILPHRFDQPAAFLGRTAANLVLELRRLAARRSASSHDSFNEDQVPGTDPTAQYEARDALRRIDAAMHRMKPRTRDIFLMSRIEGKSYAEIASALGMSEDGVRKQVARAMIFLRKQVGDL